LNDVLYQLGGVIFEIYPFNPQTFDSDSAAGIVEKPVMGRRPPLEFVGDGPQTVRIAARLFPEKLGGLGSVSDLNDMRMSGMSQYLMRGDGVPMGWFAVERISERHTYLGPQGVGRVVDIEINLRRSDPPNAANFFASIAGILG
jgi:phage protein U